MSPDHFCFLCNFFFICSEHSTFAGCHILCWVKAECSCSKASYFFSKAFCIMGLTGILDHNKLVIVCNLHYGFHVCRVSVQVDRHNAVSYTHLRAHETDSYLVCRLLLEKKKKKT